MGGVMQLEKIAYSTQTGQSERSDAGVIVLL